MIGILLANFGSPDVPKKRDLRKFLKEVLSDERIIAGIPRLLWMIILHGVILNTRTRKVAKLYNKIWTKEGSPILVMTNKQATQLTEKMELDSNQKVMIAVGMRYGNPGIYQALGELKKKGCQRLLVLPLYPQYSLVTTASTLDSVNRSLADMSWFPEWKTAACYHDHPGYVRAVCQSILEVWAREGEPQKLIVSFHGIPKGRMNQGDNYYEQCLSTAKKIAEALGLQIDQWQATFQSRFDNRNWTGPFTRKTLRSWARQGIKHVDVVCPGFSADCLETLWEIDILGREAFLKAGGEKYRYIKALNDREEHIEFLSDLVKENIKEWL